MSDITTTGQAGLPADFLQRLSAGIAEKRLTSIGARGDGKDFLRLIGADGWVFGPGSEEVQDGSKWIVNVYTLAHGWGCWVDMGQKNELRGEVMASMINDLPEQPAPVDGTPYKEQVGMELKCSDGTDAGHEVQYKNGSHGGREAVMKLLDKIHAQIARDPGHPYPVITLDSEWYDHPKYKRVYKPVFTIVGWADVNGVQAGEAPAQLAPEPAKAAPRKPPLEAAAAPLEPSPTAQQHTGQRRRPAAR